MEPRQHRPNACNGHAILRRYLLWALLASMPLSVQPLSSMPLARRKVLIGVVSGYAGLEAAGRGAGLSAGLGAGSIPPCSAASDDGIRFEADDKTFGFDLPPRWVPATAPDQERVSSGHLISVRAAASDGSASLQAVVDGGIRGRQFGSSLNDLGPIEGVAQRLVEFDLLNDAAADFGGVVSSEGTGGLGGTPYYLIRYQIGGRPAIAKLAVVQQRLYCIKVRAAKEEKAGFFEREGALLADMEAIAQSFSVVAVNAPCLQRSNKGSVPDEGACRVLRP